MHRFVRVETCCALSLLPGAICLVLLQLALLPLEPRLRLPLVLSEDGHLLQPAAQQDLPPFDDLRGAVIHLVVDSANIVYSSFRCASFKRLAASSEE